MSRCCKERSSHRNRTWLSRTSAAMQWVLPSIVLAFVPKCPTCVAAYLVLWTGLGVSFTSVTYLRWFIIGTCVTAFALAAWMQLGVLRKILLVFIRRVTWR
ncbi:hypothetical protein VN12_05415 [Pirellula sp. SH-Sr6A]|uniref:hypothetical protein n=1 Tax=Pirellula sp. SH-Sr6A TaxID=1632865 RepID=UPI00078B7589|nr:hypothetical protein [Pirellula sp. SH-Sr6A]AMV31536.1 hypothetical protein VN12_05415 [Pirellula sp. SH-Sr6A]